MTDLEKGAKLKAELLDKYKKRMIQNEPKDRKAFICGSLENCKQPTFTKNENSLPIIR